MGQEHELAQARLFLYTCARDVLGSAMKLLSLSPLSDQIDCCSDIYSFVVYVFDYQAAFCY